MNSGLYQQSLLGSAAARGTDQLQASLFSAVDALGELTGIDFIERWGEEGAQRNIREMMENPARVESFEDIDGLATLGAYVLETLAEEAPSFLLDAGAFVIGSLTSGVGGAASVAGRRALLASVGKNVSTAVGPQAAANVVAKGQARHITRRILSNRTGGLAGIGTSAAAQTVGETQMELAAEGVEAPVTALAAGAVKGALDIIAPAMLLKMMGRTGMTRDVLERTATEITKEVAQVAGTESVTEAAQTVIDKIAVEANARDSYDLLTRENLVEIVDSALRGGIAGGALAGGGVAAQHIGAKYREQRDQVMYDAGLQIQRSEARRDELDDIELAFVNETEGIVRRINYLRERGVITEADADRLAARMDKAVLPTLEAISANDRDVNFDSLRRQEDVNLARLDMLHVTNELRRHEAGLDPTTQPTTEESEAAQAPLVPLSVHSPPPEQPDQEAPVETLPESNATIAAQLRAMDDDTSTRDTVFFANGTEVPQRMIPKDAQIVDTSRGLFVTSNLDKAIRIGELDRAGALDDAAIGDIIFGQPAGKEGTDGTTLVGRDVDGNPVAEVVTGPERVDEDYQLVEGLTPDDGTVEASDAETVIDERNSSLEAERIIAGRFAGTPEETQARIRQVINDMPPVARQQAASVYAGAENGESSPISPEQLDAALFEAAGMQDAFQSPEDAVATEIDEDPNLDLARNDVNSSSEDTGQSAEPLPEFEPYLNDEGRPVRFESKEDVDTAIAAIQSDDLMPGFEVQPGRNNAGEYVILRRRRVAGEVGEEGLGESAVRGVPPDATATEAAQATAAQAAKNGLARIRLANNKNRPDDVRARARASVLRATNPQGEEVFLTNHELTSLGISLLTGRQPRADLGDAEMRLDGYQLGLAEVQRLGWNIDDAFDSKGRLKQDRTIWTNGHIITGRGEFMTVAEAAKQRETSIEARSADRPDGRNTETRPIDYANEFDSLDQAREAAFGVIPDVNLSPVDGRNKAASRADVDTSRLYRGTRSEGNKRVSKDVEVRLYSYVESVNEDTGKPNWKHGYVISEESDHYNDNQDSGEGGEDTPEQELRSARSDTFQEQQLRERRKRKPRRADYVQGRVRVFGKTLSQREADFIHGVLKRVGLSEALGIDVVTVDSIREMVDNGVLTEEQGKVAKERFAASGDLEGLFVPRGRRGVVIVRDETDTEAQQNRLLTIAHELGHGVLRAAQHAFSPIAVRDARALVDRLEALSKDLDKQSAAVLRGRANLNKRTGREFSEEVTDEARVRREQQIAALRRTRDRLVAQRKTLEDDIAGYRDLLSAKDDTESVVANALAKVFGSEAASAESKLAEVNQNIQATLDSLAEVQDRQAALADLKRQMDSVVTQRKRLKQQLADAKASLARTEKYHDALEAAWKRDRNKYMKDYQNDERLAKSEWFADKVAAYAINSKQPRTLANEIFSSAYEMLRSIWNQAKGWLPKRFHQNKKFSDVMEVMKNDGVFESARSFGDLKLGQAMDAMANPTGGTIGSVTNGVDVQRMWAAVRDYFEKGKRAFGVTFLSREGQIRAKSPAVADELYHRSNTRGDIALSQDLRTERDKWIGRFNAKVRETLGPGWEKSAKSRRQMRDAYMELAAQQDDVVLSPLAKSLRAVMDSFYTDYLAPRIPNMGRLRDYFPHDWQYTEIEHRLPEVARILEKYGFKDGVKGAQQLLAAAEANIGDPTNVVPKLAGFMRRREFKNPALLKELVDQGFLNPDPVSALQYYIEKATTRGEFEKRFGGWVTLADEDIKKEVKKAGFDSLTDAMNAGHARWSNQPGDPRVEWRDPEVKLRELIQREFPGDVAEQEDMTAMVRDAIFPQNRQLFPLTWSLYAEAYVMPGRSDIQRAAAKIELEHMRGTIDDAAKIKILNADQKLFDAWDDMMTGLRKPLSPKSMTYKTVKYIRIYESLRVLTFSGVASIPEVAGVFARQKGTMSTWDFAKQAVSTIKNWQDAKEFSEAIGVITHDVTDAIRTEMTGPGVEGRGSKALGAFFKWNGNRIVVDYSRTLAAAIGKQFLIQNARKANGGDERAKRYLEELNIDADTVERWAVNAPMWFDETLTAADRADAEKVQGALTRFVYEGTMDPIALERPSWAEHPLGSLVFHLKTFMYSYTKVILSGIGREFQSRVMEGKTYTEGYINAAGFIASTAAIFLFFGLLSEELRQRIQSLGSRGAWGKARGEPSALLANMADRAGFTAIPYFDFVVDPSWNNAVFQMGPTVHHGVTLAKSFGKYITDDASMNSQIVSAVPVLNQVSDLRLSMLRMMKEAQQADGQT